MSTTKQNDLQSFGELENMLYGGIDCFSYFQKDIKKCLPFSQIPVEITKSNGSHNFGYEWTLVVDNNSGDYLSGIWLELEIPQISLKKDNTHGENGTIRWTENLMHNIIESCTVQFNYTNIITFDNYSLDFLSEFVMDDQKYNGYMKGIGNIPELTSPSTTLPARKLYLPLPLFMSKDSGNVIPLSGIPHTEIKIVFNFRNWEDLLIYEDKSFVDFKTFPINISKDLETEPVINDAHVYGNFIIVSDVEKSKIGLKTKHMLIEQVQTASRQRVDKSSNTVKTDLLFKNAIKTIYFGVRNCQFKNVWSNYNYDHVMKQSNIIKNNGGNNIIKSACIKYDNDDRVIEMPHEYFHKINPYYNGGRIPTKEGMYMYSFALNQIATEPNGSVNLSKITKPTLHITLSDESLKSENSSYELVVLAVSNNIIKISEGSITLPIKKI